MRFRMGLAVGFASGYVLGTRAGRERYEQLVSMSRRWMGSEPGQAIAGRVTDVIERVEDRAGEMIRGAQDGGREVVREASVTGRAEGGNGKI